MSKLRPVKFLVIVESNPKGQTWSEVDYDEFLLCMDRPQDYQMHVFDGETAKICVAVWNKCCDRAIALKTASSFVSGAYLSFTLNPDGFDPYVRCGISIFNPPY